MKQEFLKQSNLQVSSIPVEALRCDSTSTRIQSTHSFATTYGLGAAWCVFTLFSYLSWIRPGSCSHISLFRWFYLFTFQTEASNRKEHLATGGSAIEGAWWREGRVEVSPPSMLLTSMGSVRLPRQSSVCSVITVALCICAPLPIDLLWSFGRMQHCYSLVSLLSYLSFF